MKTKTNRLTKAEKRVAIAKDVIAQVKKKKFEATRGTYFCAPASNIHTDGKVQLQDILPEISCQVCGIGSLFASKVNLYNNCTLGEVSYKAYGVRKIDAERGELIERLRDLFSRHQLDIIEAAFEGRFIATDHKINNHEEYLAATKYPKMLKKRDAASVMIAIMQNIIHNEGTFVVPQKAYRLITDHTRREWEKHNLSHIIHY